MLPFRDLDVRSCVCASLAALTLACGEQSLGTTSDSSTSTTTTAASSSSSSGEAPTTGEPVTTSTTGSTSGESMGVDASSSSDTGATTIASTTDATTSSTSDAPDTTSSSSSSSETDDGTSTGTSTGDESSSTGDTTGDESGSSTGDDFQCEAPAFPDATKAPKLNAGCPQPAESQWCLALSSGGVKAIGLDSQTTCQVAVLQSNAIEVAAVGSIGVVGSDLFTCTSEFDGRVARVLLLTGAVEVSTTPCSAVTTWRGRIVVQDQIGGDTDLDIYTDWAAVMGGQIAWSFPTPGLFSETLAVRDDVLFAAWHSDNHAERFGLPCGEPIGTLLLDGFDNWMQGIAVTPDQRFLTYGFSYGGLVSFDADLGTALAPLPNVQLSGVGLACFAKQ